MQKPPAPGPSRLSRTGVALLSFWLSACATDAPLAPNTTPVTSPVPPAAPAPDPGTAAAAGPAIGLSATTICFTPTFTGPAARPDDVRITSLDGSPIDGLTAAVAYDAGQPTGWLSTAFDTLSAPARLWLSAGYVGVPGTYHATVQVSSATPGVAPVSIRVTLELRPVERATLGLSLATVGLGGAGNGRLTATGIDCVLTNGVQGGDCEEAYAPGTLVHVTVTPSSGQVFYYLSGCPASGTCSDTGFDITLTEVSRRFEGGFGAPASKIVVSRVWESGLAFVEGRFGLFCGHSPGNCFAYVDGGVGEYSMTAYGEYGARFVRWEGACTGTNGVCTVNFTTPGSELHATAVFGTRPSTVSFELRGEGASGTVTVSAPATLPGGDPLICELLNGAPARCVGVIPEGIGTMTLNAVPAPGSVFAGWNVGAYDAWDPGGSPTCTGTMPTCTLTMVRGAGTLGGSVSFARGP